MADLSQQSLIRLRSRWDEAQIIEASRAAMVGSFPKLAPFNDWLARDLYSTQSLSARDRELILLPMVATKRDKMPYAIHLTWALMTGVSMDEIESALALVAAYSGIDTIAELRGVHEQTIALLNQMGEAEPAPTGIELLKTLVQTFG